MILNTTSLVRAVFAPVLEPVYAHILIDVNSNKNSSGDQIANVNFFTTTSHM